MKPIGRYLKDSIIPAGMSVSEAARIVRIGRPALSNLLNGKAALSRDMADKLAKAFGADADALMRRQSEHAEAALSDGAPGGYLTITPAEVQTWSTRGNARTALPALVRRLVRIDAPDATKVDFPAFEAGERPGWDGVTESATAGIFVPEGHAGWELTVSADLTGKPRRDAKHRRRLSDAEKARTTFVFVTARQWPNKNDWADKERSAGGWRNVCAYDASDIEQWMERSAAVQVWFCEQSGRNLDGVRSLESCWDEWSQATERPLPTELFADPVKDHRAALVEWIENDHERPYIVVADSAPEALAFLSQALSAPAGDGRLLLERAVLASTADAVRRISAASPDTIIIVADPEAEAAASSLTRRSRVVIVRPRTSLERDPDVDLVGPHSAELDRALSDMGYDDARRDQLREASAHSRTILRRQLAVAPELKRPSWASDATLLKKVIPMLLAGAWNSTNDADRMMLGELAGVSADAVETDVIELLSKPDSPVWAIGNYRGIVSRKDAFYAVGHALSRTHVETFFDVAQIVLSEDDPSLDLPPEDRWKADLFQKRRAISGAMRRAMGELLVLFAVDGPHVLGTHAGPIVQRVDAFVAGMLAKKSARELLSTGDDLPLLAEASPKAFLDALEDDLRSSEPQLLAMLRPATLGGFDSPDRTGLLWALETAAWNEESLLRVGRILARLSEVPIDDNWVNKPEGSLASLIRSWLPQTAAPVDKRIALLDAVLKEHPKVGWRLCLGEIKDGGMASPNSRPHWRRDAVDAPILYDTDVYRMRRHALDRLLSWPEPDQAQLGELIWESANLPVPDQRKIWRRVSEWIDAGPSDEDRAALRERMRRSVLSRRRRADRKPGRLAEVQRSIFDRLTPGDPVARNRWLFAEQWVSEAGDDPMEDEFDYKKHEERVDALRQSAIMEILLVEGMDGVDRLLGAVSAWGIAGHYLKKATPLPVLPKRVVDAAQRASLPDGDRWIGCLGGILGSLDAERDEITASVLRILPAEHLVLFLRLLPFDGKTWALAKAQGDEIDAAYWRAVAPHPFRLSDAERSDMVERLLAVDRPISAFNALAFELKAMDGRQLYRLLTAIGTQNSESGSSRRIDAHRISDALEALDGTGSCTVQELAQLEYRFIDALSHSRHGIPNLETQMSESPGDFVHVVSILYPRDDDGEDPAEWKIPEGADRQSIVHSVFSLLEKMKRTPGTQKDGTINPAALRAWIAEARDRFGSVARTDVGDSQIGQVLGRTKPGADGIWPNEAVREVLETASSDRLLRGMAIGLHNNRGAIWRGEGGAQERELSARYREFARKLSPSHPVTTRLLGQIAEQYDHQAEWHDTEEAVRRRLNRG